MDLNLRGKVAVITGGSVGIGLAVAEGLAAEVEGIGESLLHFTAEQSVCANRTDWRSA